MKYNPRRDPDPEEWNAADDTRKMLAVWEWHRRRRIRLPDARVHAIFHVVAENQVAMGDACAARAALRRLMGEGLDRHEALHAVASVSARCAFRMLRGESAGNEREILEEDLKALTAASWRALAAEDR